MGIAERRIRIMRILCRRGNETIANIAQELGVSTRTIRRDIDELSLTEPIYTQTGRYGGGVYVMDNYIMDRMYMEDNELAVLESLRATNSAPFDDSFHRASYKAQWISLQVHT